MNNKFLYTAILLIVFSSELSAQNKLPVINAKSVNVSIRIGDKYEKNSWTISPESKPDILEAPVTGKELVSFITDTDSIGFYVEPNKLYDFIILLNGKDSAHTQIWGEKKVLHPFTDDPSKVNLITSDIANFWDAYDRIQKDSSDKAGTYQKYYLDKASPGMQNYWRLKVRGMDRFLKGHNSHEKFYAAIRKNALNVNSQKPEIIGYFKKFKEIYPAATFPDVYFIIGSFSSGGTVSDNGLLIGAEIFTKTPDIPIGELNLWEKNVYASPTILPTLIVHELIHFQQKGLAADTTLLHDALREGMADFMSELVTGQTINKRQHIYAKGKEKKIWEDFKKEMYLNRAYNWLANRKDETPDHPADLGYWMGYQICKAWYEEQTDTKKAVDAMLHIQDYKKFLEESKIEEKINNLN
jgi:hypothetical protein